jgi:hypothetical protein
LINEILEIASIVSLTDKSIKMNNRVNSDKPNKESKKYMSKETRTKTIRLALILIGIAALYFICHYIDQYVGNLVLK